MKTKAEYRGAMRDLSGDLTITFAIPDSETALEELEHLKSKELMLEVKKYSPKRSLSANAYFWALCADIAKAMGTTQDEVHDLMLYRYGVSAVLAFEKSMLPIMQQHFSIIDIINENELSIEARCWVGSRYYNTQEMARLIDGTVSDSKDLGIHTWSREEIERLVKEWQASM